MMLKETKILNIFIITLSVSLIACSNTKPNECENVIEDELVRELADYNTIFNEDNYTGIVQSYHDEYNRYIESKVHYKNGKIFLFESFYKSGSKKWVKPIKCNAIHGKLIFYVDNNIIGYEMEYYLGAKHGVGKSYYDNGYVEKLVNYHYDQRHGEQYDFSEKGDTLKTTIFEYGQKTY